MLKVSVRSLDSLHSFATHITNFASLFIDLTEAQEDQLYVGISETLENIFPDADYTSYN